MLTREAANTVYRRRMDGHHGIKEERKIDALGLNRQLEGIAVAVKRPGTFRGRHPKVSFIGPRQQPFLQRPLGRFVDDRHRAIGNGHNREDAHDPGGVKTDE